MTAAGEVALRRASIDDAAALLLWRNDPQTRRNSRTTGEIALADHLRWLAARIDDASCRLWVASVDGEPIGQVRMDRGLDGTAEISIALAPAWRGRGYGPRTILAALAAVRAEGFATEVQAWVRASNEASLAAFARAGFRRDREDDGWVLLVIATG